MLLKTSRQPRGVSVSGHEQTSTRRKVSMTLVFRLLLSWSSSPKPMAAFPEPNRIWILEQLQSVFAMPAGEVEELFQFAKWLANQSSNPDDMIRRLINVR